MNKPAKINRAGKAALLTEILGQDQMESLHLSDAKTPKHAHSMDPASLAWARNRLIERFREKGFLKDSPPKAKKSAGHAGATKPKVDDAADFTGPGNGLSARLAARLDPNRLSDEHPAVIALFLRSQPAKMRSEVLRGLPGAQARAVMRVMRAARGDRPASQGSKDKSQAVAAGGEQKWTGPKPTASERKIRIRRAR
ncbi:MAG: hypothetical protein AAF689_11740 [Pseudomonadota bacterium]